MVFKATGGIAPYSWRIEADALWFSMQASTGVLFGRPLEVEADVPLVVFVTDEGSDGGFASKAFEIDVVYCSSSQSDPCSGNGDCNDETGDCMCHSGYSGGRCVGCADGYHVEQGRCIANEVCLLDDHCSGHGTCDDSTGIAVCTCFEGYQGEICEACTPGYHYIDGRCIEDVECDVDTCSGNGECDDSTGVPVCSCFGHWEGANCGECGWYSCMDQEKIVSSEPYAEDHFGSAVAICGEYAVVGAASEHFPREDSGAVFVFHRSEPGNWGAGTKITAPEDVTDANFGESLAISDDHIVVGSPIQYGISTGQGAAYVFQRIGENTWDAGARLDPINGIIGEYYGKIVSISGDTIVVGSAEQGCSLYVFINSVDGSWMEAELIIPDVGQSHCSSVSSHGDYIVVGVESDDGQEANTGAAYVFYRDENGQWDAGTRVEAPDPEEGDHFGCSVSVTEDYLLVGSYQEDSEAIDAGAAYVYQRDGSNTWNAAVKLVAPDAEGSDYFGFSVSISDHAVVGAYSEGSQGLYAGAAYVFRRSDQNTWDEGVKLVADDGHRIAWFGFSVAINQGSVIIGSPFDGGEALKAGAAYCY